MKPTICLLLTSAALALTTRPALAVPVPCSGGTIDIGVTSDTPLTGAAFNVGQEARFSAIASGISPSSYSWTIPGPHIKNYQEDLGTRTSHLAGDLFESGRLTHGGLSGEESVVSG